MYSRAGRVCRRGVSTVSRSRGNHIPYGNIFGHLRGSKVSNRLKNETSSSNVWLESDVKKTSSRPWNLNSSRNIC